MQESYLRTGFVRLCWQRLLTLMALNVLFLVCCLPVVTIPTAITALHCACQRSLLEETQLLTKFFRSFKQNFLLSLPLGLLFFVGPAAAAYGCIFYLTLWQGKTISVALPIFCLIAIFLFFYVGSFAFAMLARVELGIKQILHNAFLLAFGQARGVFGWVVAAFAMLVLVLALFPYSTPAILLLGISLPCFTVSRGILPVIDAYITKE